MNLSISIRNFCWVVMVSEFVLLWIVRSWFFFVLLSTDCVWFVVWFCELSKEPILYLIFFAGICILWWVSLWCSELYAFDFSLHIVINRLCLVCCLVLWVEQGVYIVFECLFFCCFIFWVLFLSYFLWVFSDICTVSDSGLYTIYLNRLQ